MLPPGIFLWESGYGEMVSPIDPAKLSELHPSWAADVGAFEPWHDVLDQPDLGCLLKSAVGSDTTIVVVGACGTTMELARLLAEKGVLGAWGAVVSVEQSKGRGQLRRPWASPPGNLHMSVVIPSPPLSGPWATSLSDLLPLVVGFVLSQVLAELGAEIQIKWPNDLLQENRKVGGMLIEEKNELVILGVGINLAESPPDYLMREDRSVPAAVLQTNAPVGGTLTLGETLVNRGKSVYAILLDKMVPAQFVSSAMNRLAWLGQRIEVREGDDNSYLAEIVGISPKGGLVIRRNSEEVVLFSGSIYPL